MYGIVYYAIFERILTMHLKYVIIIYGKMRLMQ